MSFFDKASFDPKRHAQLCHLCCASQSVVLLLTGLYFSHFLSSSVSVLVRVSVATVSGSHVVSSF